LSNRPKLRLVNSPAERRGRLNADEPGEMVFNSQLEYVEAMQARIRTATATRPWLPSMSSRRWEWETKQAKQRVYNALRTMKADKVLHQAYTFGPYALANGASAA
jgi:hypothetical protein